MYLAAAGHDREGDGGGPPHEPHHVAALLWRPGAPADLARERPAGSRLLCGQGRDRSVARHTRRRVGSLRRGEAAVPASRALRERPGRAARRPAGSASCTRVSRHAGTSMTRSPCSSWTSTALGEPPVSRYRDLTSFPEVREDLAVVVSETVTGRRGAGGGREGERAAACRAVRCSMSTVTLSGSVRAMCSLALALSFRAG